MDNEVVTKSRSIEVAQIYIKCGLGPDSSSLDELTMWLVGEIEIDSNQMLLHIK